MRSRRQRLGQHFLRDRRIAAAIADAVPDEFERVLEVGPGRGALTDRLLERFPQVRAVELDERLVLELRQRAATTPGLEVRHADAVTADLDELTGGEPWPVAANLPYSVGTPILRRFLRRPELFPVMVVMVQREVAERIAAPSGGRQRGLLTLEVELAGQAEILFSVPPAAFSPPPKVTSSVLRIVVRDLRIESAVAERALRLASVAFAQRRKKLTTTLRAVADRERVAHALAAVGVSEACRPEHLDLAEWIELARNLSVESLS